MVSLTEDDSPVLEFSLTGTREGGTVFFFRFSRVHSVNFENPHTSEKKREREIKVCRVEGFSSAGNNYPPPIASARTCT